MARRRAEGDASPPDGGVPSRAELLRYLDERFRAGAASVTKRELARAFGISGDGRADLKDLIRELEREGVLLRQPKQVGASARGRAPKLSELTVVLVEAADADGLVTGRPLVWTEPTAPPVIELQPGPVAPGVGDRVLARLAYAGRLGARARYVGAPIRLIEAPAERLVGVFEASPRGGGRVRPTDRRVKEEFEVAPLDQNDAEHGELVLAEPLPSRRAFGLKPARVVERLGRLEDPRAISLICIHQAGIPTEFSADALAQAAAAQPVDLAGRVDLRDFPLVTIDGSDARDFDDAVWAAPDDDPANRGGWRLLIAIADVAHYVTPGSPLDRAAESRGNSVYFPDRVVPMLPEALSNELCSLKPGVGRACMAVHVWIDAAGRKLAHRFVRGLMRSAARLTYEQAQAAADGRPDDVTGPLLEPVIAPLYGAFASLLRDRERRGTLDLDLPEQRVVIGADGKVASVRPRERLDAHRLIEEMMILANVCAAETLEAVGRPCMYRVHEPPSEEKLEALRAFLRTLDLRLAKGQTVRPRQFMELLARAEGQPHQRLLHEVVLRAQAQAVYSPENQGHFGLALIRYAHFTSPIRRYADILVHRALIAGLGLGSDGLPDAVGLDRMIEIGRHVSMTERRAAQAERDAIDRYMAAFMAERVGAELAARVSGVAPFGLFLTLEETQATGLAPMRGLPRDFWRHDEAGQRLVGERTGRAFSLGDRVTARLVQADVVTGSLVFDVVDPEAGAAPQIPPRGRRSPAGIAPPRRGPSRR